MPQTYEAALGELALLVGLNEEQSLRLSTFARLRNLLAHEYLDILYQKIRAFAEEFPDMEKEIFRCLKKYTDS